MLRPMNLQPLVEVIRLIREGAHVACPHVQQVARVPRRISQPTTDLLALFNQNDLRMRGYSPQKTRREYRSAPEQPCVRKSLPLPALSKKI